MELKGSCLCGNLIFMISPQTNEIYQCHCSKCRKLSGSSSNANLVVNQDEFEWIKPPSSLKKYLMEDGWESVFCENCGSISPQEVIEQRIVYVPAGLLENHESLKVTKHIYVGSKAHWDNLDNDILQFKEGAQPQDTN